MPFTKTRPLVIPRLINHLLNSFAVRGQPMNAQKWPYLRGGDPVVPQIEGGAPAWIYCEFNPLGANKTGRVRMGLPDGFVLLSYFGSASVNTVGGFRVNVYDFDNRIRLTERPVNFQLLTGQGNAPLFQPSMIGSRVAQPYRFAAVTPQCSVTIVNLENANNVIQFGLYGLQGVPQQ